MFTRSAFRAGRAPAVPEAFPESATARRKQKDATEEKEKEEKEKEKEMEEELEEGEILPSSLSEVTPKASRPLSPIADRLRSVPVVRWGADKAQFQSIDMIVESPSKPIAKVARADAVKVLVKATRNPRRTSLPDRPVALRRHGTETHEDRSTEEEKLNVADESSISAGRNRDVDMDQNSEVEEGIDSHREALCIKWGLRVWNDLTEVTIYPALLIEHIDEAMIVRVKDLVLSISSCDR